MRRAFTLVLAFVLLCGSALAQDWNQQTVDNSGDVGKYTAIAHDSAGRPHIVYFDSTNMKYWYTFFDLNAGAWTKSEVLRISRETSYLNTMNPINGAFCDITVDPDDLVRVVVTDMTYNGNYNQLCYLYTGSAGTSFSGFAKQTLWSSAFSTESRAVNLINPSIAASATSCCVTFYDNKTSVLRCFYRLTSGNWVQYSIDPTPSVGVFSDVAFSPSGQLYCSYSSPGNMIRLGFQTTPGLWFNLPIEQGATLDVYSSIAVDQNEDVHIAYRDINQGLKHATVTRAKLMAYAATQAPTAQVHDTNTDQ